MCAVIFLLGAAATSSAQSGYWQYLRTESGIQPTTSTSCPVSTTSGGEGNYTITNTCGVGSGYPITELGITFSWSRPPSILIPGTALYWPVSATIASVVNPNSLGFTWTAARCPYAQVSNLATASVCAPQWTPENFLSLWPSNGLYGWTPVGTVITYNNALAQAPPAPNSIGYITGSGDGDSNGLMSIITDMGSSYTGDHLWSYVYQWVPEALGSCGGTCTLASPGQNLGATGGTGSVGLTATSTWTVIAVDSWIHVTSSVSGTGNTTVTFTADPNTSGPRSGTLIIGGQQYTIFQAGSAASMGGTQTSITITNPGFETIPSNPNWISCSGTGGAGSGGAGCQDTLNGNVPGWTASSGGTLGLFQPGPNYFTLPLPAVEETTVLQINNGTLSQTLSATLQPSTLYTLQVDVGRRLDNLYPSTPPTAQLYAGSTLIASATGTEPPLGGWTTWTGTYQSSASDPLAGQTLKIVLGATASQGDFDNVRLTAGGSAPACTYSARALTQNQPASLTSGNITGLIQVNAGTGCAWTAISNNSWITVTNGTPGSGSGVVAYQVSPNTTTAARTGTLSVAGQTVTVNQAAATKCAYSISPTSSTMQAIGGASSVLLSANPSSCPWSVAVSPSASSWLHVTSPTSGTGALSINYAVDQNATTLSRSGTIALADQTLSVTQAGGASTFAPNITPGGIVNAANNRGGSVAQGSLITIYGSNLGPATPVQATAYPIPATMGNVTVSVTQGSTTLQAYLKYVSATQINAILPSNTPLGNVQLTVSYLGAPSAPATINVVATAFGIFSSAGGRGPAILQNFNSATNQPLNTVTITAKPSQILIIWATGLGPITTGDNTPPPGGNMSVPVQVLVGGQQAPLLYSGRAPNFAGVDNVYFTVPASAPLGCYIPVQVNAAGAWSNTVTISLTADGTHCKDTGNPLSNISSTGGNLGILGLMRLNYYGSLSPSAAPLNSIIDLGIGDFAQVTAGGDLAFSPFMNLPPAGSCKSTNRSLDLGSAMGTGGSSLDPSLTRMLDAGASLAVSGPKGSGTISQISSTSPYVGALGGSLAAGSSISVDSSQMEPFLDTGPFTIKGTGGADVGAFSVTVNESPTITWTNEMQIATINRSNPLTLTWTGGDQTQTMLIIGASSDPNTLMSGGFTCLAPVSAGTFTIPANALSDLVPVNPAAPVSGDESSQLGVLGMMPLPMTNPQKFTATGLNTAYVFQSTMFLESVQVK